MYIPEPNNQAALCGVLAGAPVFSHAYHAERFFRFPLQVQRLSGAADTVNVLARERLLQTPVNEGARIAVEGEVRTFNNKSGVGAKLVISLFARSIRILDAPEDENHVVLTGTICKPPALRCTPLGRSICDLMLAVNRSFGHSDYLPCIAWGERARAAASWPVGAVVTLRGRFQSREYRKLLPDGESVSKTAYEISAMEIERVDEACRR